MAFREMLRRLSGREEIIQRPNDWSQFRYHNTISPYQDPRSPAGSFYMDRYLTSKARKEKGRIFGISREGQNVNDRSRHVYSIRFDESYSNVLLEDDYPHLLWSLIEEFVRYSFYERVYFEGIDSLQEVLFQAIGADVRNGIAILDIRDTALPGKKESFLSAYNQAREQAKRDGRPLVGAKGILTYKAEQ